MPLYDSWQNMLDDDRGRGLKKFNNAGDVHDSTLPQSDAALEAECLVSLEQCQVKIKDLERELADLRSKHIARMTPQSRAALESMGHDLKKSLNVVQEASLQWQHRLNDVRKSRSRSALSKSAGVVSPELQAMRAHARAVNSGEVIVARAVRRRLVETLGRAELEYAEACR